MRYRELHSLITSGASKAPLFAWASGILHDVDSGRSSIGAVAHPLGFVCLPIERAGALGVCLHLWPPEPVTPEATTSQIHCHSWELLSFVLYGRIGDQRIGLADGHECRVFEVTSNGDEDDLRPTERTVRIIEEPVRVHEPAGVYDVPPGAFHRTFVTGGAGTIALGRTVDAGRDLSLGPPDKAAHRTRRRSCHARELSRAVRAAAAQLDRPNLR